MGSCLMVWHEHGGCWDRPQGAARDAESLIVLTLNLNIGPSVPTGIRHFKSPVPGQTSPEELRTRGGAGVGGVGLEAKLAIPRINTHLKSQTDTCNYSLIIPWACTECSVSPFSFSLRGALGNLLHMVSITCWIYKRWFRDQYGRTYNFSFTH